MRWSKLLFRFMLALGISAAAFLLYRAINRYSWGEVAASLGEIPGASFARAAGFAAASYFCLTLFDWLAVRYAGKPLPWRKTALASFTSLSIGHNIGVAALSSGAIRYRFYSRWGLGAGDVARVIVFSGLTVGLGLGTLAGVGLLLYPAAAGDFVGLGRTKLAAVAAVCLAAPAAYLLLARFVRGKLRLFRWELDLPPPPIAAAQIVVGVANFACVAGCLHQLLLAFGTAPYLDVMAVYVIGNVTALVSHVPGGIGVLEATIGFLLPGGAAISALIAFRVIYFFIPLALGLPLLLASEYFLRSQRDPSRSSSDAASSRTA